MPAGFFLLKSVWKDVVHAAMWLLLKIAMGKTSDSRITPDIMNETKRFLEKVPGVNQVLCKWSSGDVRARRIEYDLEESQSLLNQLDLSPNYIHHLKRLTRGTD